MANCRDDLHPEGRHNPNQCLSNSVLSLFHSRSLNDSE